MIHLTQTINELSFAWIVAMLRAVWQGAIALSIAWAVGWTFPRLPARMHCWLWRAAYFKLLIALVWAAPINLPLLRAKTMTVSAVPLPVVHHAADPPSAVIAGIPTSAMTTPAIVDRPIAAPVVATPAVVMESRRFSVAVMLLSLWIIGVLIGCLQLVREWIVARRLRSTARPIGDAQLMDRLTALATRMGLRRLPPILSSPDAPGPLLTGQFRPVVILPTTLVQECSVSKIEIAVAHELAHVRRHDLLWCWLARINRVLFFFHPLVLLTQRDWHEAQEIACDEFAVAATGIRSTDYGDALLSIISMSSFPRRRALALGIADSRKNLERRLLAMKLFTSTLRQPWTHVAVLVCVMVVGMIPFRVTAQTSAPPVSAGEHSAPATQSSGNLKATPDHSLDASREPTIEEMARFTPRLREMLNQREQSKKILDQMLADSGVPKNGPDIRNVKENLASEEKEIEEYRKELIRQYVMIFDPDGTPRAFVECAWPLYGVVEGVSVKIAPQMAGVIKQAHCANGQPVKKGDLLIQLSDTGQQAQVAAAQAALAQTKVVLARQQKMFESHATGIEDVEKAKMDVTIGQIRITLAEQEELQTRIVAPIDGIIIDANQVVEDQPVKAGEVLAVVVNTNALVMRAEVSPESIVTVKVGQKVIATSGTADHVDGVITFISPQINRDTGKISVEASIDNKGGLFRSGAHVTVKPAPEK